MTPTPAWASEEETCSWCPGHRGETGHVKIHLPCKRCGGAPSWGKTQVWGHPAVPRTPTSCVVGEVLLRLKKDGHMKEGKQKTREKGGRKGRETESLTGRPRETEKQREAEMEREKEREGERQKDRPREAKRN